MSSRRKSSTPCMVRVTSDLPEEQGDPEEVMDVEMLVDNGVRERGSSESCESAEKSQDPQQENPENPDQQMFPKLVENQNPEPLEQEEQSGKEDQDSVTEDVGGGELKDREVATSEMASQTKQLRGYECKYCPFSTQNLNNFKEHVDSSHPNVILNPLYLCAVCNFSTKKFDSLTEHNESQHPGETNFKFKRVKMNNQTILEQTIEDNSIKCYMTNNSDSNNSDSNNSDSNNSDSSNSAVFPPCISTTLKTPDNIQSLYQGRELKSQLDGLIQKDQITAVNINGTVIIPEPTILQGLSHVTPLLQRPPNFNCIPKIAVPLNTTKYNPSLDNNLTLITSFNKFPYPTHAELSWLTAASKHPEDQIKVWFTTQRLKQGITWSPEEVEEARKKMFNGSIPPAHHTFTVLPASPISQPSSKASQHPVVHTVVEHMGHVRTSTSNGLSIVTTTTNSPTRLNISSSLKRPLPTHMTTMFCPESKRPIMAVAPHSGDPKEKGLMAPPPPPPPLKDRLPMAPPPVPMEMKRPVAAPLVATEMKRSSAAVPLMPPPSSPLSLSLSSKGKLLSSATALSSSGNHKTKPLVSLPSIVFPHYLKRSNIVPPPIIAPPYKNYLIPHPSSITSKEKHPITHALLAPDMKLPISPPLIAPQIRRPTIIQSIRTPAKTLSHIPGFPSDGKKLKEQQGLELKASYPRGDKVLTPLSEANGVSRMDAKWPHDQTSPAHNNGVILLDGSKPPAVPKAEQKQKSSVPTQFPLLERMKGKTAEQLKILEENFLRNSFPTHSDVDNLAAATRLSHQEIDSWFLERRALRDNLEQALLNSMGTKRISSGAVVEKRLHQQQQQHQTLQLNGIHKPSSGGGHLKSPPPPSPILPIIAPVPMAPSIPNLTSCSVPPDSRSLALLKDVFAQTRWPSPEEFSQLEARTGLARTDLVCWFSDSRSALKSSSMDLTELFHNSTTSGLNGRQVSSSENTPSIIQRCQEGGVTNNSSSKVLEGDLGRLMEQRTNSLSNQQLQDWFSGRLRQQSAAELKNGGQNGGLGGGGAREVFGSWLEDGHSRRGRELFLDREKKMAEDTSGRLTG
ncbi:zinc fingers and homeoboxes protein 2 [Diretmus argenteus]